MSAHFFGSVQKPGKTVFNSLLNPGKFVQKGCTENKFSFFCPELLPKKFVFSGQTFFLTRKVVQFGTQYVFAHFVDSFSHTKKRLEIAAQENNPVGQPRGFTPVRLIEFKIYFVFTSSVSVERKLICMLNSSTILAKN